MVNPSTPNRVGARGSRALLAHAICNELDEPKTDAVAKLLQEQKPLFCDLKFASDAPLSGTREVKIEVILDK